MLCAIIYLLWECDWPRRGVGLVVVYSCVVPVVPYCAVVLLCLCVGVGVCAFLRCSVVVAVAGLSLVPRPSSQFPASSNVNTRRSVLLVHRQSAWHMSELQSEVSMGKRSELSRETETSRSNHLLLTVCCRFVMIKIQDSREGARTGLLDHRLLSTHRHRPRDPPDARELTAAPRP